MDDIITEGLANYFNESSFLLNYQSVRKEKETVLFYSIASSYFLRCFFFVEKYRRGILNFSRSRLQIYLID